MRLQCIGQACVFAFVYCGLHLYFCKEMSGKGFECTGRGASWGLSPVRIFLRLSLVSFQCLKVLHSDSSLETLMCDALSVLLFFPSKFIKNASPCSKILWFPDISLIFNSIKLHEFLGPLNDQHDLRKLVA